MTIQDIRWTRLKGVGLATDCPPGQVYDYTLAACRPAIGDSPGGLSNDTVTKWGFGAVLGVMALGVVGSALTAYFIWRIAKKQDWV